MLGGGTGAAPKAMGIPGKGVRAVKHGGQCSGPALAAWEGLKAPASTAILGGRACPWGSAHLSHPCEHPGVAAEVAGIQEREPGLGPGVSVPRRTTGGAGLAAAGDHPPVRGGCSRTLGGASAAPTGRADLAALLLGVSGTARGIAPAQGQPCQSV